ALLHDIGITINFYSHARHGAYMIQNAKLFGLTHKEKLVTSAIAGWHNGVSKSYFFRDQLFTSMLTPKNWDTVNKLALILALAESLDYTQSSLLQIKSATVNKTGANLLLHADGTPAIEMHQIRTHLKWFAKTFGVPLNISLVEEKE
ncbi:MAG TPA: exopolyphosphatase, partial [Candidatus Limousia pullorum]|nr:exopolyphosphatase [Candidatus Limousia pullorum]